MDSLKRGMHSLRQQLPNEVPGQDTANRLHACELDAGIQAQEAEAQEPAEPAHSARAEWFTRKTSKRQAREFVGEEEKTYAATDRPGMPREHQPEPWFGRSQQPADINIHQVEFVEPLQERY